MRTFSDFVSNINGIVGLLIPLAVSIGLLVFIWGVAKFILHASDDSEREKAKKLMFWGLVALFVMVSTLSIVRFLYGEVGFTGSFVLPQLPQ